MAASRRVDFRNLEYIAFYGKSNTEENKTNLVILTAKEWNLIWQFFSHLQYIA